MPAMIQATGLTHYYGPHPAIQDVNFGVERGRNSRIPGAQRRWQDYHHANHHRLHAAYPRCGFPGRLRCGGTIAAGQEAHRLPSRDRPPLHRHDGHRLPEVHGHPQGMSSKDINRRTSEVVDMCRLGDYRKSFIGKLSKGFRQRVGVAQAILHEPEVLVLDEPTIGIDPIQVVETRRLIQDLGKAQTVVLSSHILPEVSMICQRVLIIHEGRIVAEDTPANLAQRLQGVNRLEVEITGPREEVLPALRRINGVSEVTHRGGQGRDVYSVLAQGGQDLRDEISRAVVSSGWSLLSMQLVGMSLEEIFLKLTTQEEL